MEERMERWVREGMDHEERRDRASSSKDMRRARNEGRCTVVVVEGELEGDETTWRESPWPFSSRNSRFAARFVQSGINLG